MVPHEKSLVQLRRRVQGDGTGGGKHNCVMQKTTAGLTAPWELSFPKDQCGNRCSCLVFPVMVVIERREVC